MTAVAPSPRPVWGFAGFFAGVAALALVIMIMNGVFDPPAKSVGTTIGELAAEIRSSAREALKNGPSPAPEAAATSLREIAMLAVPVLAAIAAICGAIGLFRREERSLPLLAIAVGGGAVLMQFAMWLALLICGMILMTRILSSMDGIIGFSFFDWFGN